VDRSGLSEQHRISSV